MENKSHALAAGLFVLLVGALLLALALWLARDVGQRNTFEFSTREPVSGLQLQAAVRYRGIAVGKVIEIGFDPVTVGNVRVRIAVDPATPMTRSTYATLGFQGVTGLSFVQLDDSGESHLALDTSDDAPARIPLKPGLLSRLTDQGGHLLGQLDQASGQLNRLLATPQQQIVFDAVKDIGQAAQALRQLSVGLDRLTQAQFGANGVKLPQLAQQAQQTLQSVQALSSQASQTLQQASAADGTLGRLASATDALGRSAAQINQQTLPHLEQAALATELGARQLQHSLRELSDNPQALLYGYGALGPGPGEAGFLPPAAAPSPSLP